MWVAISQDCVLLPGLFGVMIQMLLGVLCLGILVTKKEVEERFFLVSPRSWIEFLFDISKQLFGGCWIHGLSILTASLQSSLAATSGDACSWYFLNLLIDCTLGVLVEYELLVFLRSFVAERFLVKGSAWQEALSGFGEYGATRSIFSDRYLRQLSVWIAIVTVMKVVVVLVMLALHSQLAIFADAMLYSLNTNPAAKLVVVMVVIPVTLNAAQCVLVDQFLKKRRSATYTEKPSKDSSPNRSTSEASTSLYGTTMEFEAREETVN